VKTHSETILSELGGLGEDRERLIAMTLDMWHAAGGASYPLDLYANAAINRSLALSTGFQTLIESFNLVCAGPILRLQIDTALRFYASYIAPNADDFAIEVLKGVRVDKLKDRDGKLMRDAYLVERLASDYPWLPNLYEKTSGYVHMSKTHMHSTFGKVNREEFSVEMKIGWEDKDLPDSVYSEFISAFRHSTDVFAYYLAGWIQTKRAGNDPNQNPQSNMPDQLLS
jgi:hypothetical protein